jgi:hypothetical protein
LHVACSALVSPPAEREIVWRSGAGTTAANGVGMQHDELETLDDDQLSTAQGGISAAANFIMQHESGGSTTAGHLHKMGRGDGTRGNQSSAFGAFQMIEAQRKHYMGSNYQSTSFGAQYAAATHYVNDRYGGWNGAEAFWKRHRWY